VAGSMHLVPPPVLALLSLLGVTTMSRRIRARALLHPEVLENRTLLANNVFAQFDGLVPDSFSKQRISIVLTPSDFSLRGGSTVLGFHLEAAQGSSLDPAAVQIHTADGTLVTPKYVNSDLDGNTQSLALAALTYGAYTLDIAGDRGTSGAFHLDIFLAGDANGDRQVNLADGQLIESLYGTTSASTNYSQEADANLDGRIDSFDYTQWRTNLGDFTSLNPLTLTADLSPSPASLPDGTLVTNVSTVQVVGITNPGFTVGLETGNDTNFDEGSGTADAGGQFSIPVTLAEGANTLRLQVQDGFGQQRTVLIPVIRDSTAPSVTLVGPSSGLVTNTNLSVTGTVEDAGSGVAMLLPQVDGVTFSPIPFDASGHFSFTTALALDGSADGTHTVTLTATDRAGNVSTPASLTFTLNTITPPITITAPASGLLTNHNVTVEGLLSGALLGVASLQARVDEGAPATVASDASGHFNFTTALALDGSADGVHTVQFQAIDQVGGLLALGGTNFTLDTIAPLVKVAVPSSGLKTSTNVTMTGKVTDVGTGVALLQSAIDDGALTGVSFDAAGLFSLTTTLPLDGTGDGPHTLHLIASDRAGNVSIPVDVSFTLVTQAPTIVILSPASGIPTKNNVTVTGTVGGQGTTSLQAQLDAGDLVNVPVDGTGHFSFTTALALDGTADGSHTIRFQAMDGAGNVSPSATVAFRLETQAPTVTITNWVDGRTVSSNQKITGMLSYTGSGSLTLQAQVDGGLAITVPIASGTGVFTFTTALPLDGTADKMHTVTLVASDDAGNASTPASATFTLNTLSVKNVQATLVNDVLIVNGTSGNDKITVQQIPNAVGGSEIDVLVGDDKVNVGTFNGGAVREVAVYGLGGNDYIDLSGLKADARVLCGSGNNTVIGGSGTNTLLGGPGNDTLIGGSGTNVMYGGDGTNVLKPGSGENYMSLGTGVTFPPGTLKPGDHDIEAMSYSDRVYFDLIHRYRDAFGIVVTTNVGDGTDNEQGDSLQATGLATAAAALRGDDAGTYQLLLTLRDQFFVSEGGETRLIRHPLVWDYIKSGAAFVKERHSPVTKDGIVGLIPGLYYAFTSPGMSDSTKALANEVIQKYINYFIANQWSTIGQYPDNYKAQDGKNFANVFDANGNEVAYKGPEAFILAPNDIYAIKNVAGKMNIADPTGLQVLKKCRVSGRRDFW